MIHLLEFLYALFAALIALKSPRPNAGNDRTERVIHYAVVVVASALWFVWIPIVAIGMRPRLRIVWSRRK